MAIELQLGIPIVLGVGYDIDTDGGRGIAHHSGDVSS
jgi:hypothetical protein